MPIRFRCAYCNQLLGIARRKGGTVVRCPTCAGQVVVPGSEADGPAAPPAGGNAPLFERSDFDELFDFPRAVGEPRTGGEVVPAAAAAAPPAGAWGTHAEPALDVDPLGVPRGEPAGLDPLARPAGLVLSPTAATVLTVVVVVALGLAFGAGVLVGRLLL